MCSPRYAEEYNKSASSNIVIQYSGETRGNDLRSSPIICGDNGSPDAHICHGRHEYEGHQRFELAGDTVMHSQKEVKRRGGGI